MTAVAGKANAGYWTNAQVHDR